jgi:hypothetical protein
MLQLNPTIPIIRNIDNMKGYAIIVIDYSQEHDLLFTCAMDNGEIWTYSNKNIKIQNNISLNRKNDDYIKPPLHTSLKDSLFAPNGTLHNGTPSLFAPNGTLHNGTSTHEVRMNDLSTNFTSLTTAQQNAIIEGLKGMKHSTMKY